MHAHVCTPSLVFYHLGCSCTSTRVIDERILPQVLLLVAGYSKPRGRETEPLPTLSSRYVLSELLRLRASAQISQRILPYW